MKKYQFVLMKKSFLDNLKIFFLFMAILVTLYLFLLDNKNLDKNYLYQTVLGYQTLFKFDNLAFLFKISLMLNLLYKKCNSGSFFIIFTFVGICFANGPPSVNKSKSTEYFE